MERRQARQELVAAENKARGADEKLLQAERHLFAARVPTRITQFFLHPIPPDSRATTPPRPPRLLAAAGPADDPEDGWGPLSNWPILGVADLKPPGSLVLLGPCTDCGRSYRLSGMCPFREQCHMCWGKAHYNGYCEVCPSPCVEPDEGEDWNGDEEPGAFPSDPEA